MTADLDYDVIVVGYGPTGQALTAHLGGLGVRVAAFERFASPYQLPRAVVFDHEIMRIWQGLDMLDEIQEDLFPVERYEWYGADGELDLDIRWPPNPSGWNQAYLFFQPTLERIIDGVARRHDSVSVLRGTQAEAMTIYDNHVELIVRDRADGAVSGPRTVSARFLVGADGANSFVRQAAGITFDDWGFSERWLTLDVRPFDMSAVYDLPCPRQFCDPRRPFMMCPNGRRHRRFEFMLLPGERPADLETPARTWELLEPWITPNEAELVRSVVYEFRCGLTETMQAGPVFLAGDAAHLMPPHMGQGMCSGVRDAYMLAWRLHLALTGRAGEHLLNTYSTERRQQVASIIEQSMTMGRVSCELDPLAAAGRDEALRSGQAPDFPPFPPISQGLLQRAPEQPHSLVGVLLHQGRVRADTAVGLLDDVIGGGFRLIALDSDPRLALGPKQLRQLELLDVHCVSIGEHPSADLRDEDGTLTGWLEENAAAAVLARPDHYVFGAVSDLNDLGTLVDDLAEQVSTRVLQAADVSEPAARS